MTEILQLGFAIGWAISAGLSLFYPQYTEARIENLMYSNVFGMGYVILGA